MQTFKKKPWKQFFYQTQRKSVTRDREGDHIMIQGSVQQADRTLIRICAPNGGTPKDLESNY